MLVVIYHMLHEGVDYKELRHDYLDKLQSHRLTHYLVKRLESLGHEVRIRPAELAAQEHLQSRRRSRSRQSTCSSVWLMW